MSSLSEVSFEYRETKQALQPGPLERLWHSSPAVTVFLSETDLQQREQLAFERGVHAVETQLRSEFEQALVAMRSEFVQSIDAFRVERRRYFAQMECEVVRLALDAARRVIERELSGDPALMANAVSSILARIDQETQVILKVPDQDIQAWERSLHLAETDSRCKIVGDSTMQRGHCIVQTTMGTTNIDPDVRMAELEAALSGLAAERNESSVVPIAATVQ